MFEVKALAWPKRQPAHKGHNRPLVEQGTQVYGVRHVSTGLFFTYAYLEHEAAQVIANKMDMRGLAFNFRAAPVVVSANTAADITGR